jgi:archaellum component FlaC
MSLIIRTAALAIAATLAVAACDGGDEAAVTPSADLTPSAEASAIAELSARLEQLEVRLGEGALSQLGDDAAARLGDVEDRLGGVEDRLGDVDPADLRSRVSELEEEIRLVSVAVEELLAPTNLGDDSSEATD